MHIFCGAVYTPEKKGYIKQDVTLLKSSSIHPSIYLCDNSWIVIVGNRVRLVNGMI